MTSNIKYVGMDVHKQSISIAVRNAAGKIVMECVIETKANTILQFFDGLRGDVQVSFEEGTWAAWLHDLLKPHVTKLVVCDPRRNALLLDGNQNDRVDARKLSDLLYMNKLKPVYHADHGLRTLKELVRSYLTIIGPSGSGKAMNREYACELNFIYQQLDALRSLRQTVRRELLAESKKHKAWKQLCQIPSIGPIRAAVLLGILQTPHRFRTKRELQS
jgi:transposase